MKEIPVKVRAASSDADVIARLAESLGARGLRVRRLMPELNLITGDLDEARVEEVRSADGVEAVEPEPGYQLPPRDPKTPQ